MSEQNKLTKAKECIIVASLSNNIIHWGNKMLKQSLELHYFHRIRMFEMFGNASRQLTQHIYEISFDSKPCSLKNIITWY